jgi:hypothetical protein
MTHSVQQIEQTVLGDVEAKVKSSATAATVSAAVLSVLGELVFRGGTPGWIGAIVATAVTGGLTFVAGWLTKHTPQPSALVTTPVSVTTNAPVPPPAEASGHATGMAD